MSGSKHIVFRSKMLAIIFLFLNAVSVASPVIKNAAAEPQQLISLPYGYDVNTFGSEENQLPNSSFISQHTQNSVTVKKHHHTGFFECNSSSYPDKRLFSSSTIYPDILPLPGYYANLFLYTLF